MKTIQFEKSDGIAHVTLNQPQIHNAFGTEMIAELTQVFQNTNQDPEISCVVLRGEGPSFSAGADLNSMKSALKNSAEQNQAEALEMRAMFGEINLSPKPVVAKVHGHVLGGGMGLISVCDIVFADQDTKFGFPEVKLGLSPSVISPFIIEKIGFSQARRYFLSGELFDTDKAIQLNLVHELYSEKGFEEFLKNISKNPSHALAKTKELIRGNLAKTPDELKNYTAQHIADLRTSADAQERLEKFLSKKS